MYLFDQVMSLWTQQVGNGLRWANVSPSKYSTLSRPGLAFQNALNWQFQLSFIIILINAGHYLL